MNVAKQRQGISAEKMHEQMRQDIRQIANSRGFSQIIDYWKRELELHDTRLAEIEQSVSKGKKVDEGHVNLVLVNRAVANKFLTFLVNLLSD